MPCPKALEINNNVVVGKGMTGLMTPELLSQELDSGKDGILLLDCRSPNDYNASHITGALHVALPSIMQRRLLKGSLHVSSVISSLGGKDQLDYKLRTATLVLYDDCTVEISVNGSNVISLLLRLLSEDGYRVCMLQGGFCHFQEKHGHHCQHNEAADTGSCYNDDGIVGLRNLRIVDSEEDGNTSGSSDPFPVEVMPYLYLGNAKNSADLDCLIKHDIRYIVNVTANVPNTFTDKDDFEYLQIPITDHWSQNLAAFFPKAIHFIEEARNEKKGVLVHCLAGISRSVTVTVAYLMHSLKLSLNDAYDYVKRINPNISPNFNFMGQLLDFERTIHGKAPCEACQQRNSKGKTQHNNVTSGGTNADDELPPSSPTLRCTCAQTPKCYFTTTPIASTPEHTDLDTAPS